MLQLVQSLPIRFRLEQELIKLIVECRFPIIGNRWQSSYLEPPPDAGRHANAER
jgi:hypothetical protein